jgi:single-stranded-DNA-specific exonuclease
VGLLKLSRELRLDLSHLTEDDIGFTITPRINAASRMGVPMDAFELLATTDVLEARRLVAHLDSINSERKTLVAAISREAKKHCAEKFESEEMKRVIVLGNPDWRPALLGLVANTLVEEYNRPVFLWGREGGDGLKGSCRSDGSVNVVELMQHAADALSDFGGHKMSGGFSTTIEKVHLLDDALNSAFSKFRDELSAREVCTIDRAMKLDDVTWNTYGEIEKLAPFGLGNPKPLFMFENVEIGNVRTFGKGNLHLEMIFENSRGNPVKAIAFFTKPEDFGIELAAGKRVNLVAHIEKSVFLGRIELRLRIVDII